MSEENKGLALHEPQSQALSVADSNSANLLAMVIEAAQNPEIDAGKMQAMANLAIQLQDRERETEFNRDKLAALMEMPSIGKRGEIQNKNGGVQSRYSKWEDIHKIVNPILQRHKLALSFNVGNVGQLVTVQPILSHVNGYVERGGEMALPIDTTGSKNGTQGAGSAASYGKRHTAKAMLNIVEHNEDDDGQRAGGPVGGYDALPKDRRQLVDEGRSKTAGGSAPYAEWFKALPKEQAGWLAYNEAMPGVTWHQQNKSAAAARDADG